LRPFLVGLCYPPKHLLKEEGIKDKHAKTEEELTDANNRVVVC